MGRLFCFIALIVFCWHWA